MVKKINCSTAESRIRKGLPFIRGMQSWLPLSKTQRLMKLTLPLIRVDAAVTRKTITANGVSCEWLIPRNCQPGKVLLYLHGGGFVFGITPLHLKMGAWLAKRMALSILMVEYRLGPAHPFPAPLDDCLAAYEWLLTQGYPPQKIVVAGDSAGGNLTITTMMKLRENRGPLPAAAACLSPVTDLTEKIHPGGDRKDPLLPPSAMKYYTESYVGHNDARNPYISPLFGDLSGLPPMLVHVGEEEVLREDAIRFVDRALAAGVDIRLEIYPRMWHVWQLFLELPQAVEALSDIAQFLLAKMDAREPLPYIGVNPG